MTTYLSAAVVVAGCVVANASGEARVLITEIMYNPDSTEQRGETEWVEIANVGDEAIEIKNWHLDDEDRGSWGPFACTLKPGAVAVLVNASAVTEQSFREAWDAPRESKEGESGEEAKAAAGPAYLVIAVAWRGLANSASAENEILALRDGEENVICQVNFEARGDWPDCPGGPSIYLADLGAPDINAGKLWRASKENEAGAHRNTMTDIFDGEDIGSPGFVPGLKPGGVKATGKAGQEETEGTQEEEQQQEGQKEEEEDDDTIDY